MSGPEYGSPEWGDDLDKWTVAYWKLCRECMAAFDKRGADEQKVRRLKKELAEAEAAFAASDPEAQGLKRQVDELLAAGEKRGFRV